MFKEYITDPIRINGGMDSLGRGLREYVKDKQYAPEIAGDEFGEMVMDVFSQVNTNISRRVEGAAPIPTNHPLSLCLKDRDFEYIVADEQEQAPAHLHIPSREQVLPVVQGVAAIKSMRPCDRGGCTRGGNSADCY